MEQLTYKVGTKRNPILIEFKEYNGRKLADIRKYYIDKEDSSNLLPTRKGISLNSHQLVQLIDTLSANSKNISGFFENNKIEELKIDIKPTIGRSFNCHYENNNVSIVVDEHVAVKMDDEKLQLFSKMLEAFNSALHDVIEDDDEINMILDIINQRILRYLWL